jgi:uncharacterized membrane protein YjjP (DUF1212 family)
MTTLNLIPQLGSSPAPTPPPEGDAFRFIELFARALHRYGLPAHRVEDALVAITRQFGYLGEFFATPTAIFLSLSRGTEQRTLLLRLDPGEINLEKLGKLDAVLKDVIDGTVRPAAGISAVESIVGERDRHGPLAIAAGFTLASASASSFFGGGVREFIVCAVIGLSIGLLSWVASRFAARFRVFESTAAMLGGLIAAIAGAWFAPVSVFVATCAGLIVLVPGLSVTLAINELATRNLSAGTVRLANALLTFLKIGFGVAVGLRLGTMIAGSAPPTTPTPLPGWTLPLALSMTAIAFTILFQARPRDIGWIGLAGFIAFGSARLGSSFGGPEMGAFAAALTVGLVSNIYARISNRSVTLMLVPGIMLIVPGSVGFRGISKMLEQDIVGGIEFGFMMVMTGVALVTGLLIAGGIVSPRRSV